MENTKPEPTHVFIDNVKKDPAWYEKWVPIIIAIGSIVISIISLYYNRKTVVINTRPYVWPNNSALTIGTRAFGQPEAVIFTDKGYPAIASFSVKFMLNGRLLKSFHEPENIHFPGDDKWWFALSREDSLLIFNRPVIQKSELKRIVTVDYTDLDNTNKYETIINQNYIPIDNQWRTISSNAK